MTSTEFYRMRRAKNLCVDCGKELPEGQSVRCNDCRIVRNATVNQNRAFMTIIGICPRCQKNRLYGQEKTCVECRAEHNNARDRRIMTDKESHNEKNREYSKKHYEQLKQNGICPRCGKRKAPVGYVMCEMCRYKARRNQKQRGIGGQARVEQGLCYFCGKPVEPGYKVCEEHHRKNIEYARSVNAGIARESIKAVMWRARA